MTRFASDRSTDIDVSNGVKQQRVAVVKEWNRQTFHFHLPRKYCLVQTFGHSKYATLTVLTCFVLPGLN